MVALACALALGGLPACRAPAGPAGCGPAADAGSDPPAAREPAPAVVSALAPVDEGAAPPPPRAVIDARSVMAVVSALPAPRTPGTETHLAARRHLVERLEDLGWRPEPRPFEYAGAPSASLANLEVRLAADTPDAPVLIACAHYDTVPGSPGADDNGSGVAVLLELARRFAGRSLPVELRLLFVDAEELGLVGSREYVLALGDAERARIAGVVVLESVGYADRRAGSQSMPPFTEALLDPGPVGDFVLVLANQDSAGLAASVADGLAACAGDDLRVVTYDRLPGQGWLVPDSRRSDHASFWDASIPAVMVTDTAPFRNPHYHRRGDVPETLDGPFLAAVARGVERALLVLAGTLGEASEP